MVLALFLTALSDQEILELLLHLLLLQELLADTGFASLHLVESLL